MYRLYLITLFLAGCANGASVYIETDAEVTHQHPAPRQPDLIDAGIKDVETDVCKPQTFAADQIPSGFQFDIDCPPNIYYPPRWIPPWDPSPIIKSSNE